MPQTELTPREEQVLRRIRLGGSNKEIATDLGVSEQAVKAHVSRLLLKFGVPNRTALAQAERTVVPAPTERSLIETGLERSRVLRDGNRVLIDRLRLRIRDVHPLVAKHALGAVPTLGGPRSRAPEARREAVTEEQLVAALIEVDKLNAALEATNEALRSLEEELVSLIDDRPRDR